MILHCYYLIKVSIFALNDGHISVCMKSQHLASDRSQLTEQFTDCIQSHFHRAAQRSVIGLSSLRKVLTANYFGAVSFPASDRHTTPKHKN
jgi:hypothetical protein